MIINYPDTAEDDKDIFDVADEGRCNLVLIAIRYTGPRSSVPPDQYRNSAGWPGGSPLQGGDLRRDGEGRHPGTPQGALIADWIDPDAEDATRTVDVLEADPDIQVLYTPESIAEAMLEANYLDPKVFNPGSPSYNPDLREHVFDALGLANAAMGPRFDEAEYRRQLREIAGLDDDEDAITEQTRDDTRVTDYRQNHTRQELIVAASILGRENAESAGIIELSTWLADQDPEAVRYAFEGKTQAAIDTNAGEDAEVSEPFTADDAVDMYSNEELKDAVKATRGGTGEFSLRGATNEDMARFLVEQKGLSEDQIDAVVTG